jgi:hypothetical protein
VLGATFGEGGSWLDNLTNPPTGLVSLLGARLYLGPAEASAYKAWDVAAQVFHHFRKAEVPGHGRPPNGSGSHSTWPEADTIRQLRTPAVPVHNTSYAKPEGSDPFPRAQLGLPLKFQSQRSQWGYFGETEIYLEIGGKEVPRLASPVIVKPLNDNGQWRPAILILKSSPLRTADLRIKNYTGAHPTANCAGAPTGLYNGTTDVPFAHTHTSLLDVLAEYLTRHARWTLTGVSAL